MGEVIRADATLVAREMQHMEEDRQEEDKDKEDKEEEIMAFFRERGLCA